MSKEITLRLVNDKVQFLGVSEENLARPIQFDYAPPVGDGDGYKGIELLMLSFAGCVSTAIVFLLRKKSKNIRRIC